MNPVMRIVYASWDFVVINAIILPLSPDPIVWGWYSICILLAFALRLGMEHKRHKLTWISLLYECIYTVSWCFFTVLIWATFLNYTRGFEIYLFINSLFASFMVSQFEQVFQNGFKTWLRLKVGKFLAQEQLPATPVNPPTEREDEQ
jgi:hypothetical protein